MNTQNSLRMLLVLTILVIPSCGRKKNLMPKSHSVPTQKKEQTLTDQSKTTSQVTIEKVNTIAEKQLNNKIPKHRRLRSQRRERNLTNQSKTISQMNFDELKKAKELLLSKNNKRIAIKYVERMLKMCEDITVISDLTIELADLYFDLGELSKAEILFTQFSHLYPGSDAIEYTSYKAVLCSFYATLHAERDQSKTHHTIDLADSFIERKDIFTKYLHEVTTIRTSCYKKAIESEANVFNFYLNRNKLISAQHRLNNIRKEWFEKFPEVETQLAHMEFLLHDKKNKNNNLAIAKNNKTNKGTPSLLEKASEQKTVLASANIKTPHLATRF